MSPPPARIASARPRAISRRSVRQGRLARDLAMVDGGVHAPDPQLDGRVPGRRVHHRVGHQDGVGPPRAVGEDHLRELGGHVRAAEAGPQHDPHAIPVVRADPDPGVVEGHARGRDGHLRQPVHAAQGCGADEVQGRKIHDQRCGLGFEAGRVERGDRPHAGAAAAKPPHEGVSAHTERRDETQAGHYHPLRHRRPPPGRRIGRRPRPCCCPRRRRSWRARRSGRPGGRPPGRNRGRTGGRGSEGGSSAG